MWCFPSARSPRSPRSPRLPSLVPVRPLPYPGSTDVEIGDDDVFAQLKGSMRAVMRVDPADATLFAISLAFKLANSDRAVLYTRKTTTLLLVGKPTLLLLVGGQRPSSKTVKRGIYDLSKRPEMQRALLGSGQVVLVHEVAGATLPQQAYPAQTPVLFVCWPEWKREEDVAVA